MDFANRWEPIISCPDMNLSDEITSHIANLRSESTNYGWETMLRCALKNVSHELFELIAGHNEAILT